MEQSFPCERILFHDRESSGRRSGLRCGGSPLGRLTNLRGTGLPLEVRETRAPGQATVLASGAYGDGFRKFIAVGGDGTNFEIVNGPFSGRGHRQACFPWIPATWNRKFVSEGLYRERNGPRRIRHSGNPACKNAHALAT